MVLEYLLQVLLIEALRSASDSVASPGLLRGLADGRLSAAIRQMHAAPQNDWTIEQLANAAGLSRSVFFERFRREVGVPPMEYLLSWRMALAKNLLRRREGGIKEIAQRVGYGSASAFSVAFARFVGMPPTHYVRETTMADAP
jgi:transcriptional regulator GlxA family with amidase domain